MSDVRWSNCLWHAFLRWKQNRFRGALVVTKSPFFGIRSHFSKHLPNELESFVPLEPRDGCPACVHKFWFRGEVKTRRTRR